MNATETPLHKPNTPTIPQGASAPPPPIITPPQSNESPPLSDQASRLPFPRLIAAYLCLCLCYFTIYLDTAGVTTALPTISTALSAGPSITWAGTAYLLGQTAFQPLYGRLSDITGRKPILLASIACTALGGLLCGFARTPTWLYTARALSGVGGGGISSTVAIVVSDLVSLKERGKYQGIIGIAIGAGATTGPFIAASLTGYHEGWRWTFWVPGILAAVCWVLVLGYVPLKSVGGGWREKAGRIDWVGIGASVGGIVLVLIPISSGGSIWPWRSAYRHLLTISPPSSAIPMITIGGICLIAFTLYEGYMAKLPIMPWRLFKRRSSAILLVQGLLHDFVWQATQYFIPLYLQTVRGYTPLQSATLILPFLLAQTIAGASTGPVMFKTARYNPVLRTGFIAWTLGAALKLIFSRNTPIAAYVCILAIEGLGSGWVHQPGLVALQALSTPEDRAVATSTRNLLRSLGGVAGVAVSTAVQFSVTEKALRKRVSAEIAGEVLAGRWAVGDGFKAHVMDARMQGFQAVFAVSVPLIAICLVGSAFVDDEVLRGDREEERGCLTEDRGGRVEEKPVLLGRFSWEG